MKKLVLALGVLVVLAFGGAVIAPHMIDWDHYKPEIQKAITDFTGYDVTFGGQIDLAVLPSPRVVLENLSIKKPGDQTPIAALKRVEVSIALAPLFSGHVKISSVDLVDPVITLSVDKDGQASWMTEALKTRTGHQTTDTTAPGSDSGGAIALNGLAIENGTLNYSDARTGNKITLEKMTANLSADTLDGPFRLKSYFVWNGREINADVQAGKIDRAANAISVQATVNLPVGNTAITYAGVVGLAGGVDLQGETEVRSDNVSSALSALSGTPSAMPPLSLDLQGVLTAKGERADIKNMKLAFGDLKATGTAGARNLQGGQGPAVLSLDLTGTTPLHVDTFLPVKSVNTVRAAPEKGAPLPAAALPILPQSITLPMPLDLKARISFPGFSYKGADFGAVKISLDKTGAQAETAVDVAAIPGGGSLAGKATVTFSPESQGRGGAVVYSDPGVAFDVKADAQSPEMFLSAVSGMKDVPPALKQALDLEVSGKVRGAQATIEKGTLKLGKTEFALGESSFTRGASGRPAIMLSVMGKGINLDALTGTAAPSKTALKTKDQSKPEQATADTRQALRDMLAKINLPVDLGVKAALKDITLQGVNYAALDFDGSLNGSAFALKSATLQDSQGNIMQASGSIKDIHTLAGVDMTLSGKSGDANALLKALRLDTAKLPKAIGPLELSLSLTGERSENLVFNATAKAMDSQATASGTIVDALSRHPAVDKLTLQMTSQNFEKLTQKFVPGYKAGVGINKSMDASASVNMSDDGYDVSALKANIGGMDLTGAAKIRTSGAKPDITADLNAGDVPLGVLSGQARTGPAGDGPRATVRTGSDVSGGEHWSHKPLNAAILNGFNLALKLNAKTVEYGGWRLKDAVLALTLKDGTLTIDKMDAGVYGGTMDMTAMVKVGAKQEDPLSFSTKAAFKGVELESLASSFGGGASLIHARGKVSLRLNARSTGASPASLVSALSGDGQLDGENVVLKGFDLAAMSRSLVSTTKVFDNIAGLAGAAFSGGETAFDKIDGPFTIAQGNINFDKFLMQGPAATITSKGQISLPRWAVDIATSIALAQPKDAPTLEMKFSGPLDNPGKTFAGNAMQSYLQRRVGTKLEKVLDKKLGNKNPAINNLMKGILGVPPSEPEAVPSPAPAAQTQIQAAAPAPAEPLKQEAQPEQPRHKPTREEKINNVLQGILGAQGR